MKTGVIKCQSQRNIQNEIKKQWDIAQRSVQRTLTPCMSVQFALSQPKNEVQTMPITKEYITLNIEDIIPYENNPRINDDAVAGVVESIKQCGELDPIEVDENNVILSGHTRLKAYEQLQYSKVSVLKITGLTEPQKRKYRLLTNKTGEKAEWDFDKLGLELDGLDFDGFDFGFDVDLPSLEEDGQKEVVEDDYDEEPPIEPKAKLGDLWILGSHRLICGDSTDPAVIDRLMDGVKADLVFTDPPYGMKKESEGVLNDSLNFDDLLDFNRQWIPLTFGALKDNGSWYCWGIDEPLMDIYSNILKPMQKENKITFRNLITWDKGNGQGQLSEDFRMYPIADEKCLFVMMGKWAERGFGLSQNVDNYFDGFEKVRTFLVQQKGELTIHQIKDILGHSDKKRDHWFTKSQWELINENNYNKLKEYCKAKGINAFWADYSDVLSLYDEQRKIYNGEQEIEKSKRPYFDNTHDNMNNVWHFDRAGKDERKHTGGHATPKPIALCSRAIKSSSREGEIVLDVFGGSGSTLIACEQLNIKCYMAELAPEYVSVIVNRWLNFTGRKDEIFCIRDGQKLTYDEVFN